LLSLGASLLGGGFLYEFSFKFFSILDFNFIVLVDFYSVRFLRFVSLISCVVIFYGGYYMGEEDKKFIYLVILFVLSIGFLILAPFFWGVIIGWDGLGVTSFLLVIYYNNTSSLRSGLVTIYTNRLGDISMLFSICLITGVGIICADWIFCGGGLIVGMFVLLAGITRRAQVPFSSWLPAAISAPTPVSSLVHSSTLVTAGVYLFFRFFYIFRYFWYAGFMRFVSLVTSFIAGIIAFIEVDLKKLVAISTLRQLGLMIFILSLGDVFLCYFHIITHALFKSLLFLSCGVVILIVGGLQDMRYIGGKSFFLGLCVVFMAISNMSLIGVPFLSGFFSKDLILERSVEGEWGIISLFVLFFSCVFSVFYSLRIIKIVCGNNTICRVRLERFSFFSIIFMLVLLAGWSIFLGRVFRRYLFMGELSLVEHFNKLVGIVVLLFGTVGFWISIFSPIIFFFEMGFLNWIFGAGFRKNLLFVRKFSMSDMYWVEGSIRYHIDTIYYWAGTLFLKGRFFTVVFVVFVYMVLFFFLLFSLIKV